MGGGGYYGVFRLSVTAQENLLYEYISIAKSTIDQGFYQKYNLPSNVILLS